ncbi:UNVERIFIED_CONTAM: hypothetical protein GTU68_056701 [Idotea baltica]|nr:hypothetical protein [Idotea baltica]
MRFHTGSKPFGCNLCPYRSYKRIDMKRHIRIHTGEKPYECPHCHAKFSQKTSLSTHLTKNKKLCYEKPMTSDVPPPVSASQ